jgi:phosphinothricin acetyltransferase
VSAVEYAVEPMREADAEAVLRIYAEGIATGQATFRSGAPAWPEWHAGHLPHPRLVARARDGRVLGWCALSPTSRREVYAGVVEESVYVAAGARGRGVGRALLEAMVRESEAAGIWTLQAGIFPENEASIAVHEACGFRAVGLRERIGRHDGRWRDVLLMERRSRVAGRDE